MYPIDAIKVRDALLPYLDHAMTNRSVPPRTDD